ncbi:unnamed protein product [Leptidea sinapis]|uniref:Uncharacterized protein n=1 Tax=Leptidea sinapis TaxID=189913 RepID=A0A5E4PSR7_9NEOP|nr:unnamed protein product [Leptidea sinapis]
MYIKMKLFVAVVCLSVILSGECRSLPEEQSVVSVYTSQTTTGQDVYHQIASNIAEKITSPLYRFLGFNKNVTDATTKKPWDKIELLDETPDIGVKPLKPVNNDISNEKDVEELSAEAIKRTDKKPEKITLYSSYLPAGKLELNETNDEDFGFDDDDDIESDDSIKPREGPFVLFLEVVGSIIQLIYGGFVSLFQKGQSQSN